MSAVPPQGAAGGPFLVKYWRGEGPLWRAYWLYGVVVSLVLAGLYVWLLSAGNLLAQQLLLPLLLLYTAWIVVAVWRCAPNSRRDLYTQLARWLTVAWAINVLLLLGFLQIELLSSYLG